MQFSLNFGQLTFPHFQKRFLLFPPLSFLHQTIRLDPALQAYFESSSLLFLNFHYISILFLTRQAVWSANLGYFPYFQIIFLQPFVAWLRTFICTDKDINFILKFTVFEWERHYLLYKSCEQLKPEKIV